MIPVARDLRYGARLLWTSPGFSAIALLALGLGMGATTSIFSVVDAVLWKPLPFRDPERLLVIWEKNASLNKFRLFVAGGNFREWQKQSRSIDAMAALQDVQINLTGGPNGHIDPEELRAERVSADLFPLLGVQPLLGRAFLPEEDQPGRANYVLLSHALWARRFGADRLIVGKAIRLRDQSYTVVGVLPAGFAVLDPAIDVWLPLGLNVSDSRVATARTLMVVARERQGIPIEQVHAELDAIGDRLEQANPALNHGWRPSIFPLQDELFGKVREALLVLLAAVGFLLLMASANVANLLLVRGAARRKEMATRAALGATPAHIAAQLLCESLLLALAGGVLGLLLAQGGVALLKGIGPGAAIPRLAAAHVDARLLCFALGISLVSGALFGMVPALQISRDDLGATLAEGGRGGSLGRSSRMVRSILVVVEVALAVTVLIGAGLLIRSFLKLRATDPGFQPGGLLSFRLPLAGGRNSSPERRIAFFRQVEERIGSLPGVRAAGAVNALPLTGLGVGTLFTVDGRPAPAADQKPLGLVRSVSSSYFRTMGIPLIAGREFTDADTTQAPRVAIVNQTLARRFWPQGGAVGGRLVTDPANGRVAEIVGVVGDVKPDRLEGEDWPTIYGPYAQAPFATMLMVVRTAGAPASLASAVEREVHQLDPDQPVADVRPVEAVVDQAVAGARFNTVLLSIFAGIAFLLAAVGIYGVISYDVSRRTGEIGIRLALGAQPRDVLQLILGQAARLAAYGIAAGLLLSLALTRLMTTMLFGVQATDVSTFAAISLALGLVAMAASFVPTRRAMALDPVTALRHE